MKRTKICVLLACVVLGARAQTRELNLNQCIDMALRQNLGVQAAQKQVERAKTMQATAWDVDKTELSLSQDPSSGGSIDNALSLSQSIEFPTLYIARRSQLKAETAAQKSRVEVEKAQLAGSVKSCYWQLVYETERLHVLQRQDSILSRYREVARSRYKAGETRQLEQLAAERLQRENKLEITQALSQMESSRLRLASLLGTDEAVIPADRSLQPLDFVQRGFNYSLTPQGLLAQSQLAVAQKQVAVAKNGYAPSLSLALRHQLVISSWNPYHIDRSRFQEGNFMGFEVGVGIPLFYGATKARLKAARQDYEIAQLEMEQQRRQRQHEYDAALSQCNAAFARANYYMDEGQEKDQQLEKLSHVEYENGEISYVEYIEMLKDCIDFHLKRAAAINDFNQSVIALKSIEGEE